MTRAVLRLRLCAAVIACMAAVVSVDAAERVLYPSTDLWLRESDATKCYENDLLSVWAPGPDANRYSLLAFDLGGITRPIASARLELYAVDYVRNATATRQSAALITPTTIAGATWDSFHSDFAQTELESFGAFNIPADSPMPQYYVSSSASAADLAAMNSQKAATNSLAFVLKPVTWEEEVTKVYGRRDWADSGYYSGSPEKWPRLVLNGGAIELTPSIDAWIRQKNNKLYENDWISVWHEDAAGDGKERVGLLKFDLSGVGVEITDAKLQLFAIDNAVSTMNWEAFEQAAFSVDPNAAIVDYTSYAAASKTAFELLGHYQFLLNNTEYNKMCDSDIASAADVALLNSLRTGGGLLTMGLESVPQEVTTMAVFGGQRDWADTGYYSTQPEVWPRLVIEEIPEPSTIVLIACGLVTLLVARRRGTF